MLRRLITYLLLAPDADPGALAAVSAAIAEATPPELNATDDHVSGGDGTAETVDDAGADPPVGGEGGSGAPDPAAAKGEAGEEEGGEPPAKGKAAPADPEADRGDGRNARGEFVEKAGETAEQLAARRKADPDNGKAPGAKPPAKPEIDPATGKPKAAAPKKVDHVNDPIPADLKAPTKARMEGLVNIAKALTTERDTMKAELVDAREFLAAIEETGADAETYARHLNVLALMHSPRLEDKRQVLEYFRKAVDKLGTDLGETPAGKDALAGHQDLIDDVEAGEIKRERAVEIASARNREAAATRINTDVRTRETAQTDAQRAEAATKKGLNDLSAELRARDGALYDRKHRILVPFIKKLNRSLPSDQLVQSVRDAYEELKLSPTNGSAAPAVGDGGSPPGRAPGGTGAQQPMRPRNGAGAGGTKEPKTALEAMELGLEQERASRGRV